MGAEDAAVPDHCPGQNGDAIAYPNVVSNGDRTCGNQGTLSRWCGGIAGPDTTVPPVGVVGDQDAAAAKQVFPDRDAIDAGNVNVVRETSARADANLWVEAEGCTARGVGGYGFEPKEITGVKIRTEVQGGGTKNPRKPRHPKAGGAQAAGPKPVTQPPAERSQRVPRQIEPAMASGCASDSRCAL